MRRDILPQIRLLCMWDKQESAYDHGIVGDAGKSEPAMQSFFIAKSKLLRIRIVAICRVKKY